MAYDNGDAFNPTQEGICKTTETTERPACPAGTTYGTSKCPNSCEECTAAGPNGCIASKCTGTSGTITDTVSVSCSGDPRPTSYSYSTGGYSHSSTGSCNGCSTSNGSREGVLSGFKADYDNQFNKVKGMVETYKATINSYIHAMTLILDYVLMELKIVTHILTILMKSHTTWES